LLRRRPTLVAAERQLAAATANIGVATADLFPRISLVGLIGFVSNHVTDLGTRDSQQYSLGAGLTWPLLDFGRVRSRIAASEARAQQSLASYEQTVAIALEETEGALTQFTGNAQQAGRLASAARNAEEATRCACASMPRRRPLVVLMPSVSRWRRDALVQSQVGFATRWWRSIAPSAAAGPNPAGRGGAALRPAPAQRESVVGAQRDAVQVFGHQLGSLAAQRLVEAQLVGEVERLLGGEAGVEADHAPRAARAPVHVGAHVLDTFLVPARGVRAGLIEGRVHRRAAAGGKVGSLAELFCLDREGRPARPDTPVTAAEFVNCLAAPFAPGRPRTQAV
jgi:multidrug efflux system outer membrane protein